MELLKECYIRFMMNNSLSNDNRKIIRIMIILLKITLSPLLIEKTYTLLNKEKKDFVNIHR